MMEWDKIWSVNKKVTDLFRRKQVYQWSTCNGLFTCCKVFSLTFSNFKETFVIKMPIVCIFNNCFILHLFCTHVDSVIDANFLCSKNIDNLFSVLEAWITFNITC